MQPFLLMAFAEPVPPLARRPVGAWITVLRPLGGPELGLPAQRERSMWTAKGSLPEGSLMAAPLWGVGGPDFGRLIGNKWLEVAKVWAREPKGLSAWSNYASSLERVNSGAALAVSFPPCPLRVSFGLESSFSSGSTAFPLPLTFVTPGILENTVAPISELGPPLSLACCSLWGRSVGHDLAT